jgi:hypothetical protein
MVDTQAWALTLNRAGLGRRMLRPYLGAGGLGSL